ncbi:bilirubin utilization transcriptional regulator BilQ [Clostridium oceanicum]|uniref:HTH marR-type domain-containing protein n=1 Tax=Clostridium oceanicum TaxID=1543 RepID=A0ABN1JEU5_9CLOT
MTSNKIIFESEGISQYICILYKDFQNYCEERLKPYNLTKGVYYYLILVSKKPGITSKEISEELKVDKGYTARTIKKLNEYGYIKKVTNDKDKKSFNIYPTKECEKVINMMINLFPQWEEKLLQGLSKDEACVLNGLLKKCFNNL